jgi:hypothetical protein
VAVADYDETTNTISVVTPWNEKIIIKQTHGARWD